MEIGTILATEQEWKALTTGSQVIDNITLYFYPNGVQAKDAFVSPEMEIPIIFKKILANWFVTVFGRMTTATGTIVIKKGNF